MGSIDILAPKRIKRRRVEALETVLDIQGSMPGKTLEMVKDICSHPGFTRGLCIVCGKMVEDNSGVPLEYIHQGLRLSNSEIDRLRFGDLKNLFRHKKLYLVLDLDHTLLNSTGFVDITPEEEYLKNETDSLPDALKGSVFKLESIGMVTKLRPFVQTFLREANNLFDMYIYTMGKRAYALEMAKLLDPENVYFNSKVIAQEDCTQTHQKSLDVIPGQESAILILDDTESVWRDDNKANLIVMERYHFFASSCRQFGFRCKSLSERKRDESTVDGALANILEVLKRIHATFFDTELEGNRTDQDARKILKTVREGILKDCKIVFSGVFPKTVQAENHRHWKLAEKMGATCSTTIDESVTHVVSVDSGTEKSRWAIKEKKFLVLPRWIEATHFFWRRQLEENFPVTTPTPTGIKRPRL